MSGSPFDIAAALYFAGAWIGYHVFIERAGREGRTLNGLMDEHRRAWMRNMAARETRIVDTQIMASLQNGTAFFASASLIALGGALALLRSTDEALHLFASLPLGLNTSRAMWEAKCAGLAVIFGYGFFTFAWSYRLFNYAAVLLGATPEKNSAPEEQLLRHADSTAAMTQAAGRQFNRGQRAFFFAIAYLGWFLGPAVFVSSISLSVLMMARRQFRSEAMSAAKNARREAA